MPHAIKLLLCVVLAFALFLQGCASHTYAANPTQDVDGQAVVAGHPGHAHHHHHQRGLVKTGSEAELALYAFVGLALIALFVIDLLILPGTCHDPFPCCRALISCC